MRILSQYCHTLVGLLRSPLARWDLRRCAHVGRSVRVLGRVWVRGRGRITIGDGVVVLALDMYEHSYHIDYGAKAAAYVDAYMQQIRWDNVDQLYERYSKQG